MSGWDYLWGGLQVAGGVGEVILGAAVAGVGAAATPITGGASLGLAVGGAAIGAHGLDQIYAGLTGNPSYASQIGGAAAEAVGLPAWVGEIAGDIGPGFGGLASQIKNLPKLVQNISTATGKALASGIAALRKGGALKHVLAKLSPEKLKELYQKGLITAEELREAGIDPNTLDEGVKTSKTLRKALALDGVTAEELELAAKSGNTPEQIAAREKIAKAYYEQVLGMSPSQARSHMDGINFNEPVSVGVTTSPEGGIQWNSHGGTGQYTTRPPNTPSDVGIGELGVDPSGRIVPKQPHDVTIPAGTPVMESTASPFTDTHSLGGRWPRDPSTIVVDSHGNAAYIGQHASGGGPQIVHPPLRK